MLLVGILLLAAACSKDPAADIPGGGPEGTGKTITAAFDLTRDFEQAVEVKAAGTEDVSTINDLWVLQLAADGTCLLQSPLYFSSLESVNGNYRAEFKVQEAPCKMVFVANTHDKNAYAGLSLTSTEAEAAAVTREITAEADLTVSGAPMSGTWSGTPVTSVPGKVSMGRAICKVNFNLGADLPTGDSYEMLSLQVRQVPAVLNYYRDDATLNDFPYPDAATSGFFDYPLQAFENLQFAGGGILLIIRSLCGIFQKIAGV